MKIRNSICSFAVLAIGLCTSTSYAQEESSPAKKAWEIGIGGSLINWNRVSLTGSDFSPELFHYNMKVDHVMPGANLYIARELTSWFYLDIQSTMGIVPKDKTADNKTGYMWLVGPGVQFRLSPLFKSKYVEPYLRIGANYLRKDFSTITQGTFADDKTGTASWQSDDIWSRGRVTNEKSSYFPLSFGLGFQTWINNHVGIGLQGDYVMSVRKDEPQFAQVSMRVMFRIGGEDKRPRPQVHYIEIEKPIERIVEKEVEVIREKIVIKHEILEGITFDFAKSTLRSESSFILDKVAEILKSDETQRILITGYTDAVGSKDFNRKLSIERAKRVYDELIARGVSPEMLKYRGVGSVTSVARSGEANDVRRGDRKITIEKITDKIYWDRLQ